jgi:hypothetical protein
LVANLAFTGKNLGHQDFGPYMQFGVKEPPEGIDGWQNAFIVLDAI